MIIGIGILFSLIIITVVFQLLTRMKNVPPSQLAVVHGKAGDEGVGFKTFKGGRVFVLPLIHRFSTMDLTPKTTTVAVESAIANGIVPLVVKATVSFGVASTRRGLVNAVKRILYMTQDWDNLISVATSIIEGHLRDSLAQMTPEEVMSHKERLVKNMIQVCKGDLEGIGLEITTMNIADVEDHRFEGVEEPDLYIALLKRVQTASAEVQSRTAQANARAAAAEQEEARRAEVEVRRAGNEKQQLEASTKLRVAQEQQRAAVGIEQAQRHADAEVAGILQQIEAEKQKIAMLEAKYKADIITPTQAQKEKRILTAQADAASMRGSVEAELEQIGRTIEILKDAGSDGLKAYVIEKFEEMVNAFAGTMDLFPAGRVTVVSGGGGQGPISAVHPGALDMERNRQIAMALAGAAQATDPAASAGQIYPPSYAASDESEITTAGEAIERLKQGNERYVMGQPIHGHSDPARMKETARGDQHPFATVVGCSDSRCPVELLFDQGIGDLFVIRVAGNVCGGEDIASVEYGVDHLGTPLLVVLGHSGCGAIATAAADAETAGPMSELLQKIRPAVAQAKAEHPKLRGERLERAAVEANVWRSIAGIIENSEVVRDRANAGKLNVVGAIYDLAAGRVNWLGPHPEQDRLLSDYGRGA